MLVKPKSETAFTEFVSGITYNPKGQRERILYGNSTKTDYTYERETFRLTGLKTIRTSDNTELQDITYTYDPVGNITRIMDDSHERVFHAGQIIDAENKFIYDALYRLTEAVGREHLALNNPLDANSGQFKNSVFVNLNDGQNLAKYTQLYSYDNAGNLVQIRHQSTANSARNFTRNMVVAPNSNRAIPDSMGTDTTNFFDANGNMAALEHLAGIDWNYRNNICKATIISRPNSVDDAEYYVYNSAGQRVRKVKEALVSGNTLIEEKIYLGGVEIKRVRTGTTVSLERWDLHVMDDKSRIAIANHWTVDANLNETDSLSDLGVNKIRYQYGNHLGSASLELNGTGQIISYEEYFPYGGTSFLTGQNQKEVKIKEYRYTGKERDDATGLYYHGARYYACWLGRWLSCDPAGLVDGLNLYAYCKNNPIILNDPNGMESDDKTDIGFKFPEGINTVEDLVTHLTDVGTFEYKGKEYFLYFEGKLNIETVDGVSTITGKNLYAVEMGDAPVDNAEDEPYMPDFVATGVDNDNTRVDQGTEVPNYGISGPGTVNTAIAATIENAIGNKGEVMQAEASKSKKRAKKRNEKIGAKQGKPNGSGSTKGSGRYDRSIRRNTSRQVAATAKHAAGRSLSIFAKGVPIAGTVIGGVIEYDETIRKVDNTGLALSRAGGAVAGSIVATVATALLISNPVGWGVLGAIGLGIVLGVGLSWFGSMFAEGIYNGVQLRSHQR